jgi:anti-sigma B factor antagonist
MPGPDPQPAPDDMLVTRMSRVERGSVLAVDGEVDMTSSKTFRTALDDALGDAPTVLVVDLSTLTFLGSVGLSHLVDAHVAAGAGVLRVVAGGAPRRAIELTGLDQLLSLVHTVDEGFAAGRA